MRQLQCQVRSTTKKHSETSGESDVLENQHQGRQQLFAFINGKINKAGMQALVKELNRHPPKLLRA